MGTRNVGTGSQARRDAVVLRVIAVPGLTTVVAGPDVVPTNQFLTLLVVQIDQQLFFLHDFSSQINQLWVVRCHPDGIQCNNIIGRQQSCRKCWIGWFRFRKELNARSKPHLSQ